MDPSAFTTADVAAGQGGGGDATRIASASPPCGDASLLARDAGGRDCRTPYGLGRERPRQQPDRETASLALKVAPRLGGRPPRCDGCDPFGDALGRSA